MNQQLNNTFVSMVLVTGGTGLVGAHLLIHLIEKGETVRAIYRNPKSIQKTESLFSLYKKEKLFNSVHWIQSDILDVPSLEKAFTGITEVYHCAAFISFDPKEEDIIRKTNIEGTANIVNFCLAFNIKKLCFISSIAALGDLLANENVITETTEWNPEKPHSDYAISKYGAEMEIWRGQQEGLKVLILNPGVILGPGFWNQGSGLFFSKIKRGISFYTTGTTGFIAVKDVVETGYDLMKSTIENERFTLVAQNLVFRDFINSISDAVKVKRPRYHAKPLMMTVLWKLDWIASYVFGQQRQISKMSVKAAYSKGVYANDKIKNALNKDFRDIHQYIKEVATL